MIKIYLSNTLQEDIVIFIKQLYSKAVKIHVIFQDQQYVEEYSKILWNQRIFLPHAIAQDTYPNNLSQEEWYNRQPIFLTSIQSDRQQNNDACTCIYIDSIPNVISDTNVFFCHINNIELITQLKQHQYVCYVKTGNLWHESK